MYLYYGMADANYDIFAYIGGGQSRHGLDGPDAAPMADLVPIHISECALSVTGALGRMSSVTGSVCSSKSTIAAIGQAVGVNGPDGTIIAQAKAKLDCNSERCVLDKLSSQIGEEVVKRELTISFKVKGPTGSRLLSNVHIDATLKQWMHWSPDFYAYNFNMRDYASRSYVSGRVIDRPDTLATILFKDLYTGKYGAKYKCAGCIINTDTYSGPGKHWMALFADARGDRWTVEFFNSSGNAPSPEWVSWLEKTRIGMEQLDGAPEIKVMRVSNLRHQKSKSECGVYSLFYIWARVHNIPPEQFSKNAIPDKLMFEFRQHLFADPTRMELKTFDWDAFKGTTKIEWEKS